MFTEESRRTIGGVFVGFAHARHLNQARRHASRSCCPRCSSDRNQYWQFQEEAGGGCGGGGGGGFVSGFLDRRRDGRTSGSDATVIKHGMSQSWVTFDWNSENFAGPSGKFIPRRGLVNVWDHPLHDFNQCFCPFSNYSVCPKKNPTHHVPRNPEPRGFCQIKIIQCRL